LVVKKVEARGRGREREGEREKEGKGVGCRDVFGWCGFVRMA